MRCALAQAVVGDSLSRFIFRDFHFASADALILRDLREPLSEIEKRDPRRANIVRCQFVLAFENRVVRETINADAVSNVVHQLDPWFSDEATKQDFENSISNLFQDAMNLWQQLQRGGNHATSHTNVLSTRLNNSVAIHKAYDSIKLEHQHLYQAAALESTRPAAILFPQIRFGRETLFSGSAIFAHQSAVIAANVENKSKSRQRDQSRSLGPNIAGGVQKSAQTSPENKASSASKHRVQSHSRDTNGLPSSGSTVSN